MINARKYMLIELHQASKWKRQARKARLVLRIESGCLDYVFLVIDLFLGIYFIYFSFQCLLGLPSTEYFSCWLVVIYFKH